MIRDCLWPYSTIFQTMFEASETQTAANCRATMCCRRSTPAGVRRLDVHQRLSRSMARVNSPALFAVAHLAPLQGELDGKSEDPRVGMGRCGAGADVILDAR